MVTRESRGDEDREWLTEREGAAESPTTEREMGDIMNRPYNHSKHAGIKELAVWMDPHADSREFIDRAISNYDMLFGCSEYQLPDLSLAQRFERSTRLNPSSLKQELGAVTPNPAFNRTRREAASFPVERLRRRSG